MQYRCILATALLTCLIIVPTKFSPFLRWFISIPSYKYSISKNMWYLSSKWP